MDCQFGQSRSADTPICKLDSWPSSKVHNRSPKNQCERERIRFLSLTFKYYRRKTITGHNSGTDSGTPARWANARCGDLRRNGMYERFTDRARKVMQLANQEAQRFNHEYIGTEHVLLGLVKEG